MWGLRERWSMQEVHLGRRCSAVHCIISIFEVCCIRYEFSCEIESSGPSFEIRLCAFRLNIAQRPIEEKMC